MQQTLVPSLGWEDLLEEGMATHSVFLPGESPWTEWATVPGVTESDTTERLSIAQHRITTLMTAI